MKYHKRFRHIHRGVTAATRELVVAKPWRQSREDQIELAQHWLEVASEAYGIRTPEFALLDDAMDVELFLLTVMMGEGTYASDGVIRLAHFSIVTLLHEFRHHMQAELLAMDLLIGERGQLVDELTGEVDHEAENIIAPDGTPCTVIETSDNELEATAQVIAASRLVSAEEIDARAWSISLFCQVAPKRFRNMVRQGRILFVDPVDVS